MHFSRVFTPAFRYSTPGAGIHDDAQDLLLIDPGIHDTAFTIFNERGERASEAMVFIGRGKR
jgi:hypothetical protein